MTRLLVSVRDADEAEAALAGGADLVDVKEPTRGALGRADDAVLAAVVRRVAGRRPVSAALGELLAWDAGLPPDGLAFVKWGLAGSADAPEPRSAREPGSGCHALVLQSMLSSTQAGHPTPDELGVASGFWFRWRDALAVAAARVEEARPGCRAVAVAYADWRRATAPEPDEVAAFAGQARCGALLLDTWNKDGTTLLDWLAEDDLVRLGRVCREAGVVLALAGSLTVTEIRRLRHVPADWIAVRGAACAAGERTGVVVAERVRELAELLSGR